jgi:hypothetical protein
VIKRKIDGREKDMDAHRRRRCIDDPWPGINDGWSGIAGLINAPAAHNPVTVIPSVLMTAIIMPPPPVLVTIVVMAPAPVLVSVAVIIMVISPAIFSHGRGCNQTAKHCNKNKTRHDPEPHGSEIPYTEIPYN